MATATKFIQRLRNFLSGKNLNIASRYAVKVSPEVIPISARTQEPPNLPGGIAHKLADNYYCSRDLRRAAAPPIVAYTSQKLIKSGNAAEKLTPEMASPVSPGPVYVPRP